MNFTSVDYFLFLPVVFLFFYFMNHRYRWLVLLIASYGFYATFKAPQLLIVLVLVTVISYFFGVRLGRTSDERRRKLVFWLGTAGCALILVIMKYLLPLLTSGSADHHYARLLLSIGVSYYTFQAISYLADIYLEIQEPEKHLGYHALYLAFFPKLLQGPIERAGDLVPQLKAKYEFHYDNMRSGMLLFTWGLFKKVVVADRLALYADYVYNDVHAYVGLPLILATYAYALQIYYDFAGYTDMARGTARMFGINLTENFNNPYMAISIADFWRRWHISFSRWLLDYIFMPLQVQFREWKTSGVVFALMFTFLLCGIWHGASRTFLVWGGLHGFFMAISVVSQPTREIIRQRWMPANPRIQKIWQATVTFHLVCFAWIFFRANSLGDAYYVVTHLFSGVDGARSFLLAQAKTNLFVAVVSITVVAVASFLDKEAIAGKKFHEKPLFLRWGTYYLLVLSILWFAADQQGHFIYFQF